MCVFVGTILLDFGLTGSCFKRYTPSSVGPLFAKVGAEIRRNERIMMIKRV